MLHKNSLFISKLSLFWKVHSSFGSVSILTVKKQINLERVLWPTNKVAGIFVCISVVRSLWTLLLPSAARQNGAVHPQRESEQSRQLVYRFVNKQETSPPSTLADLPGTKIYPVDDKIIESLYIFRYSPHSCLKQSLLCKSVFRAGRGKPSRFQQEYSLDISKFMVKAELWCSAWKDGQHCNPTAS